MSEDLTEDIRPLSGDARKALVENCLALGLDSKQVETAISAGRQTIDAVMDHMWGSRESVRSEPPATATGPHPIQNANQISGHAEKKRKNESGSAVSTQISKNDDDDGADVDRRAHRSASLRQTHINTTHPLDAPRTLSNTNGSTNDSTNGSTNSAGMITTAAASTTTATVAVRIIPIQTVAASMATPAPAGTQQSPPPAVQQPIQAHEAVARPPTFPAGGPSPISETAANTMALPAAAAAATIPGPAPCTTTPAGTIAPIAAMGVGPKAVDYSGELNIVLADEKMVPLLGSTLPLQCWGCRALVWDCQVPPCAHLACKLCVDSLYGTETTTKCPVCKVNYQRSQWESLSASTNQQHKFIAHLLYGLRIKCPEFQHRGCNAVIDYSEAKSHLEKTCLYSITRCEFCQQSFKTCEMAQHGRFCKRWLKCTHCNVRYLESDQIVHDRTCIRKPVKCPNQCPLEMRREELVHHLRVCPKQLQSCPIPYCPTQFVPRCDLPQHLNDVKLHMANLLTKANEDLPEVVSRLCSKLASSCSDLSAIHEHARMFPIAFCDQHHVMKFAVAPVSEDLPLCAKCGEELEPRQTHFSCGQCQVFQCIRCYANLAVVEDGKSRNEHWASAGLNPPVNELATAAPRRPQLTEEEARAIGQLFFGSLGITTNAPRHAHRIPLQPPRFRGPRPVLMRSTALARIPEILSAPNPPPPPTMAPTPTANPSRPSINCQPPPRS